MKKTYWIYGIVILVSLVLLSGAIPFNIGGFTTLSLSNVDFKSSDSILNGKVWILTATPGGAGQYATGTSTTIDNAQIKDENGYAQNDLTININSLTQSCEYPIIRDENKFNIYNFYIKNHYSLLKSDSDIYADCKNYGIPFWWGGIIGLHQYCVYGVPIASMGMLPERPNVNTKVDISLTSAGKTETGSITNKEQTQIKIGNDAYVQWSGGLKTYDECPQALQQNILAAYSQGKWKLIDSTKYNNYIYNIQSKMMSDSSWLQWKSLDNIEMTLTAFNGYANQAFSEKSFSSAQGKNAVTITSSTGNGITKITMDNTIIIPILTFYVKTDWLGIVQPTPKPQITSVTDVTFGTGDIGYTNVLVANIGSQSGNINTWIECPTPITVTTGTQTRTIPAGSSTSISFSLGGSSSTRETKQCTAYAQSLSEKVSKTFSVTVDPIRICETNRKYCDGDVLKTCNADGSEYSEQVNCQSYNKKCGLDKNGILSCIDDGVVPTCKVEGESINVLYEKCCSDLEVKKDSFLSVTGTCIKPQKIEWVIYLVLAALGAALMYAIKRDTAWTVVGGIIGLILAYIYQFVASNWILLLLVGVSLIILITFLEKTFGIIKMFR